MAAIAGERGLDRSDIEIWFADEARIGQICPAIRNERLRSAQEFSAGLAFPVPSAESLGVRSTDDIAWLKRRMTPHPVSTYTMPIHLDHPVGNGLPCTYIRCTQPVYSGVDAGGAYARSRRDWEYLEIATGHDAMVTAPAALTDLLRGLG